MNKHMTWTNDLKPDQKESLQVILIDIDVDTSIFHIYCLATSCIIVSQGTSPLQGSQIVLFFERSNTFILLNEHSFQTLSQLLEHLFLFLLRVWLA